MGAVESRAGDLVRGKGLGIATHIRTSVDRLSQRLFLSLFHLLNPICQLLDIPGSRVNRLGEHSLTRPLSNSPFGRTSLHRLAFKLADGPSFLAIGASLRCAIRLCRRIASDLVHVNSRPLLLLDDFWGALSNAPSSSDIHRKP